MIDLNTIDQHDLTSITALNLDAYLRTAGWEYQGKRGRYAHIFTLTAEGQRNTTAAPVFELLDDHAERILDALRTICRAEKRSPSEIFQDLAKADHDRVRIASTNGARRTPPTIGESADLLEAAHDLMSHSARAAEAMRRGSHRAAFRGNISAQVSSYLNELAFSHDFQRDCRLAIHSPAPVELNLDQDLGGNSRETPFAREAMKTLARGLGAASEALSVSVQNQPPERFKDAVPYGVSANLCDALAGLAEGGKGISISIDWSMLYESRRPRQSAAVTYQHAGILRSAADVLRRSEPSPDEQVHCYVIRLEPQPGQFDGRAKLLALRDGGNARLSAQFLHEDHARVIEGFTTGQPLSLTGDIHQTHGGLELRNPHDLHIPQP